MEKMKNFNFYKNIFAMKVTISKCKSIVKYVE